MKVQVIRSNRKTIGLEVRADESVILRAPAVDEISDVEWKSILGEFTERVNHFVKLWMSPLAESPSAIRRQDGGAVAQRAM